MKHKFILLGLLFLIGYAHAQYESFFGQQTWSYNELHPLICYTDDYDPHLIGCCITETYNFNKDDTVSLNDTLYYQSTFYGPWHYVYLREDSINGRLYGRYYIDNYEKEYLICDMSLSVGDTFILNNGHELMWFSYGEFKLLVDSITYLSGKKIIYLNYLEYDFFFLDFVNVTLRFMEGIGPIYGIRPSHKYEQSGGAVLLCLHKDEELYYMTHEDLGCYQYGGKINEYPQNYINIYPNPANQNITMDFTTENEVKGIIVIRDVIGRVCKQVDIYSKTNTISISDLPQGVYILTFMDENNRKLTKKVIKI